MYTFFEFLGIWFLAVVLEHTFEAMLLKSWLVQERLRRQAAKPRLALKRLAAELNCAEDSAILYLFLKYCTPFCHFHPREGVVYHVTWKHFVLYAPCYLRMAQYLVFALFVCNWKDFGGIHIYRQCLAIFFSTFIIVHFVLLYTILRRRGEFQSLFTLLTEYQTKLASLGDSILFLKLSRQATRRLRMFAVFMSFLLLCCPPCNTLGTIVDSEAALSPFGSQMGKDNPWRNWWIYAEAVFGWPSMILVEMTLTQGVVFWTFFSIGFRSALTRISTLLSDPKLSFTTLEVSINHYIELWRILALLNQIVNPCLIAAWRTAIVASLVPTNLLLYRWYLGSEEVRDVNPLVIVFLATLWTFMLTFGLWSFNYMGSIRIQSNEIMKAMNYYCLRRLIESNCDPEVRNQVAYLRRRIRSLREICFESSTFGKISAMADIRILEEITDYTTSGLLTTG